MVPVGEAIREAAWLAQANASLASVGKRGPDGLRWTWPSIVTAATAVGRHAAGPVAVGSDNRDHEHGAAGQRDEVERSDQAEQRELAHCEPPAARPARMASRMSRIGSTDRTRGMTSKLCAGGGEVVNHSSV